MLDLCPLCTATLPIPFLTRQRTPAMQNALAPSAESARALPTADLTFACCQRCGFVCNASFEPEQTAYDQHYENSQHHSPSFSRYLDDLVERVACKAPHNAHIVEVGCGKGEFLRRLLKRLGPGARGTGYDPAYEGPLVDLAGQLKFERRFFDETAACERVDIIICRHVIEHVPNPLEMLRAIRSAIGPVGNALVFFETPCIDWILRSGVAWDFFHEHCSLFSKSSLTFAFSASGFAVVAVDQIFGGQYLLIEAYASQQFVPLPAPASTPTLASEFFARCESLLIRWQSLVQTARTDGPVAVWGAGAKGVTFLNILDPDACLIVAAIDINPRKQNMYVPGTGHQCLAPNALTALGIHSALVTNPNYKDEVCSIIQEIAPDCRVIDLMEAASETYS